MLKMVKVEDINGNILVWFLAIKRKIILVIQSYP